MLKLTTHRFADRHAAGRELAARLSGLAAEDPVVFGLARGGVPVAYEVARALGAPLDVLVVRKIGAPGNPEYGIGAIAEGDVRVLNEREVHRLMISVEELETAVARARAEIDARVRKYRERPTAARGPWAVGDRGRRRAGDRRHGAGGASRGAGMGSETARAGGAGGRPRQRGVPARRGG